MAGQHERRAVMACLLLPPVQTFMLLAASSVLLKLRRGVGCADSTVCNVDMPRVKTHASAGDTNMLLYMCCAPQLCSWLGH